MTRIPRVFVTQYTLTKGIETYEDVLHTPARTKNGVGSVRVSPYVVVFAPHWYDNLEAAQARAEAMRQDAIAATKRRLAKLEAMKISVNVGARE